MKTMNVYENSVIVGTLCGVVLQDGKFLATVWLDENSKVDEIEAINIRELHNKACTVLAKHK